ncbi:MAG: hypothetical protein QM760_22435 [Nibricoccus sp.]
MEPPRQKRLARLALFLFATLGALWLAHLDYSAKISTNVIDLIPVDERAPELSLVRDLTDQQQARVLLLALNTPDSATPPTEAAQIFAAALKASPAVSDALVLGDSSSRDALGRFIFTRRFDLLLPTWLDEQSRIFAATGQPSFEFSHWLAERTAVGLDQFLARPESIVFQDLIPQDPLLLVPSLIGKIEGIAGSQASGPTNGPALIWAVVKDSPFSEAGQDPVFAAIDHAFADAKKITPALQLRWTGINRFAAESKNRIKAEMSWLNTASLLGVLAIACLFVRRLWKIVHLVPVVALSILGGWVVTTMAFERVHILVFVIGSLLAGVAIDYGFYLYMQPALRPRRTLPRKTSASPQAPPHQLPHHRHRLFTAILVGSPARPATRGLCQRRPRQCIARRDSLFRATRPGLSGNARVRHPLRRPFTPLHPSSFRSGRPRRHPRSLAAQLARRHPATRNTHRRASRK